MSNWHFDQKVDLRHPGGLLTDQAVMMVQGDSDAHQWRVQVWDGNDPADLTDYTVTGYFDRADGKTVAVAGSATGHSVCVVLPRAVYAVPGPLLGVLRASRDGQVITLAVGHWVVRQGPGASYVDTGQDTGLPDLHTLLERITEVEGFTAAANQAAEAATQAAAGVQGELTAVRDELDALHPLAITAFAVSPALAEKGSRVTAQTFTYRVNRSGAAVTLEGTPVTGGSAVRADVLTSDSTYTLRASLNGAEQSAAAKITFVAPVYFGVGSSAAPENATVLALNRVLTASRARTFTVDAGEGQYILFALPVSLGEPVFKVGGFEGGFVLAGMFDFTNASGHTEAYRLYRSVNAGLGGTTVAVA